MQFKTHHKLQGSQTGTTWQELNEWFKTYHKLQGSQTATYQSQAYYQFKTYHKLQGSQTAYAFYKLKMCLRHIINYKVLKLEINSSPSLYGLRHIINYKVLKPSRQA